MEKPGPKPKGKVSREWSTDLAYAVGLIATDGSLSKDGRHIELTSKDKEQILTFKKCLGIEVKIGKKQSGYKKDSYSFRIQFGDVLFYQWLIDLGMNPNKSKTLGTLKIPDKYFFDFLRGCFDGDGSIYAYWDPRWESSYMFYLTFASASPDFLVWLQGTIHRLVGVMGKINSGGREVQQLRYAKEGTESLLEKMYYNDNVSHLKRKFTKAQKILRINEAHDNE